MFFATSRKYLYLCASVGRKIKVKSKVIRKRNTQAQTPESFPPLVRVNRILMERKVWQKYTKKIPSSVLGANKTI